MISIKNLSKKYADKTIFNKINLEIPTNKITFVVGESGVGKSTLINLIAGFTNKDEGEIRFFKNEKKEKNPLIDVVFQDFNLIENLSVKNNILIGNHIIKRGFDQKSLEKIANFLNIENEKLNQQVKDLSGGEKQRVAILRAFSRNSDFILLDEPTGNLDEENAVAVFESLKKLSKNKTILVVSHNLELAKLYADQIVHIENGAIKVEVFDKKEKNQEKESENSTFEARINQNLVNFLGKFKTGFLLFFADFKTKITTFILLILTFLVFFGGSVLLTSLNTSAKNLNLAKVQEYNIDSIIINRPFIGIPFSKEDEQELLKNNSKIEKLIPDYPNLISNIGFFYSKKIAIHNLIAPIDESDFFKKRFYTKEVEGNFIKNEDEIILSRDVIKALKIENPIGKKINVVFYNLKKIDKKSKELDLNQFSHIEATIVGVSNKLIENFPYSYLHHSLIKSIFEKEYLKNRSLEPFSSISWIDKNYKKARVDEVWKLQGDEENEISKFYYENQAEINRLKLIKGDFPKNYDEIAISSNYNFIGKNAIDLIGEFLETNTNLPHQNMVFKVVGIFEPEKQTNNKDGEPYRTIVFNHQIQKLQKTLRPNTLRLYFSNDDLYQNIKNFEKNNPHFLINGGPEKTLGFLINTKIILQLILFGVLIIFSIIFFIFIGFFARNLSWSKRKTVAILKSLGAKTKNILFYHWLDLLILSFAVLFLGFVFIVPIVPEIYKGISHQDFAQPSYGQITMVFSIIWAIMFLILTLIYVVSSLWTYRKTVVKLLKN
ncbi:ATP-binding cassette domain-containing protein [Mesomycoplasma hyopneumoniae]|uniref:ATP-binding cassette domain-containing protein n=1 Tax=Mesomycoplasma hyopneumoniae TaxID=2099 RepID=UPI00136E2BC6|nr:ATP-binding cassette domain-containing protein [Mesomycoplasma hyopneumoniae]MXR10458.1 ATP-binding cassette domain-containing protein [Mesomycoplasma hyopneumoniae]